MREKLQKGQLNAENTLGFFFFDTIYHQKKKGLTAEIEHSLQ